MLERVEAEIAIEPTVEQEKEEPADGRVDRVSRSLDLAKAEIELRR
jgi:hypothetical protein